MWEELAARADWTAFGPEECNHAPIVSAGALDFKASAGESVTLSGSAKDPDGDKLDASWWIPASSCTYAGDASALSVSSANGWTTEFTVPADAKSGDVFVVNLEVRDRAERPMTRYAQYVIEII